MGLNSSCWLFAGVVNKDGYGVIWDSEYGNYRMAHRLSYVAEYGEIPNNLPLDHLCRQPRCINPEHLEAVTPRENTLRGIGPSAKYAKRDKCKNGHTFAKDNVYTWGKRPNARLCITCRKSHNLRYILKNKLISEGAK